MNKITISVVERIVQVLKIKKGYGPGPEICFLWSKKPCNIKVFDYTHLRKIAEFLQEGFCLILAPLFK